MGEPVKDVCILGVHGWFPTKFVQKIIGEPTGTSQKLVTMTEKAIKRRFPNANTSCIRLESEGQIEARVSNHMKELEGAYLGHSHMIISSHSQGGPVSLLLLSQMIKDKMIDPYSQQICVMTMAAIHNGAWYGHCNVLLKWWEREAATELFYLCDPSSELYLKYKEAVLHLLEVGVKIVCIAGWNDPVVPLYSALLCSFKSDQIFRSVYFDIDDHSFITKLVTNAVTLLNEGKSDHSFLFQSSKYFLGGWRQPHHSTLHSVDECYDLAVEWLLKNNHYSQPLHTDYDGICTLNPYNLPWIMNRLMNAYPEFNELGKDFEEWNPIETDLKLLKYILEPLNSQSKI